MNLVIEVYFRLFFHLVLPLFIKCKMNFIDNLDLKKNVLFVLFLLSTYFDGCEVNQYQVTNIYFYIFLLTELFVRIYKVFTYKNKFLIFLIFKSI